AALCQQLLNLLVARLGLGPRGARAGQLLVGARDLLLIDRDAAGVDDAGLAAIAGDLALLLDHALAQLVHPRRQEIAGALGRTLFRGELVEDVELGRRIRRKRREFRIGGGIADGDD